MATTNEPTAAEVRAWRIEGLLASNRIGNGWTPETAAARVDGEWRLAALQRIERAIGEEYEAAMRAVEAEEYPGGRLAPDADEAAIEARHGIPALTALLRAARAAVGDERETTYGWEE